MNLSKTFFSPAKLNLFFHIKSKRSDGYHEIVSFMQSIDLKDTLTISISEKDEFSCNQKELMIKDNLALKALELFRRMTSIRTPVKIHLEKRIPCQAGLGGGSSNAATTLWALKSLFSLKISNEELMQWGAELGSDVPFFFSKGFGFCTGRGEKVIDVDFPHSEFFWIASPSFGMKTPGVYQCFKTKALIDLDQVLDSFKKGNPIYLNDLESLAFQLEPKLKFFKQELLNLGFSQVTMTGSGSNFFCIGSPKSFKTSCRLFKARAISRKKNSWY